MGIGVRLIAAAILVLAGCHKQAPSTVTASEPPPVQIPVIIIQPQPFTETVAITGTLVSRARVDVKAEVIGRVLRFDKQEGDRVSAGEAIVWVDDENYKLAVRQMESAVRVSEAALDRARVSEDHARSELDRARNLVASGGITDKDLKAAEIADKDARAQTALAAAQLDQARAALEVARKHLRDTIIHAPVAGEIQKKFINPGAYVEAPTPVLTIVDNARLELESLVPSAELGPVRAGQRAAFNVSSFPGENFEGQVIEVSPAVDSDSRSAKVRIRADDPARRLKDGMFAEGRILTGVTARAIVVPAAAIWRDDRSARSSFAFVVENGKAARRTVRIGRETGGRLEILEGLNPGDTLIAEQSLELADGVRIQAAPAGTQR